MRMIMRMHHAAAFHLRSRAIAGLVYGWSPTEYYHSAAALRDARVAGSSAQRGESEP
jgi:hypothetical protein